MEVLKPKKSTFNIEDMKQSIKEAQELGAIEIPVTKKQLLKIKKALKGGE